MREPGPAFAALALGLLALGALSPELVPYNMDEFVHYQALGCAAFPLTRQYNTHREGCGSYDLRLPFLDTPLPLRSYLYIGSLPVLPFYPFWRAFRDPVAVRIQGVVFFLAAVLLSARLADVGPLSALLAGLTLPVYSFSFLVDTGPVGLSVLLLLGALLALRLAVRRSGATAFWAASLGGFLTFLGIFCKPVFLWCLPAVALYAGMAAGRQGRGARFWREASGFLAALLLPLLVLGLARDADGDRYYELVRLGGVSSGLESVVGVGRRLGALVVDGTLVLPRTLSLERVPTDVIPVLVALALLAWGLGGRTRAAAGGFLLLSVVTGCVTLLTGSAYWPHHFAFVFLFLTLALATVLEGLRRDRPRVAALVLGLLLGHWTTLVLRLPSALQSGDANRAKDRLLAFISERGLDRRTVQVHTSWGTFFISHLFGDPRQLVLFYRFREWSGTGPARAEVRGIAEREKRSVLVLSSRPEPMTDTPEVRSVLGPPLRRFRFDNWEALEYLR